MGETGELITGIFLLGAAILLARQFHGWKIKRAYLTIIEDLKSQGAHTPETAIPLPYAHRSPLRFGVRPASGRKTAGLVANETS